MKPEERLGRLLDELASSKPAPGGGSASAAVVAIAAALVEKVARLSGNSEAERKANQLRTRSETLVEEDAQAYLAYAQASHSVMIPAEVQARIIEVPLQVARMGLQVVELAHELGRTGKRSLRPDATTAAILAHAAISAVALLVQVNIGLDFKDPRLREALELRRSASESVRGAGRSVMRPPGRHGGQARKREA